MRLCALIEDYVRELSVLLFYCIRTLLALCNGLVAFSFATHTCSLFHSIFLIDSIQCMSIPYNTSLSMHVMASTINLIETFSFYVGQMSGFQSVHSLNILIWATRFAFLLLSFYLFPFQCGLLSLWGVAILMYLQFEHLVSVSWCDAIELNFQKMPSDYMLNALNASYYHRAKWLIQWNLIS